MVKIEILEVYKDKTAIFPKDIEHQVISLTKNHLGEVTGAKFHSGLSVGAPPYDEEWSISWEQFKDEFQLVWNKQEAIEQRRFL